MNFKGKNNPFYGKHHTKESLLKNRLWHLGRVDSKETKQKRRLSHLGLKHTPQEIEKIRIASTGIKFTEERKRKIGCRISLAHKKWRLNDPISYSLRQSRAMASNKYPSKPELKLKSILPKDFELNKIIGKGGEADLHSNQRKIIIEIDGPTHYKTLGNYYNQKKLENTKERDKRKTYNWENMGYKVYRFTDIDVMKKEKETKERLKEILK